MRDRDFCAMDVMQMGRRGGRVGQEADGPYSEFAPEREREREREREPESLKKAGGRPCLTAPFLLSGCEGGRDSPLSLVRGCETRGINHQVGGGPIPIPEESQF